MSARPNRWALLIDLDDTLYDYATAEAAARSRIVTTIARETSRPPELIAEVLGSAREAVKGRLGKIASSHSRLLYLAELAHRFEVLPRVRSWEAEYWETFLRAAELRPGARELLADFRRAGGRIAIVTDLTLDVQLRKLEAFDLFDAIDVLVTSEEVPADKPDPAAFELALSRLGAPVEAAVVVGDSRSKDGIGAETLGVPFLRVGTPDDPGPDLFAIGRELLECRPSLTT